MSWLYCDNCYAENKGITLLWKCSRCGCINESEPTSPVRKNQPTTVAQSSNSLFKSDVTKNVLTKLNERRAI